MAKNREQNCRAITSRRRPQLAHDKCRVVCSDCFYKNCCEAKKYSSWFTPLTCYEHGDWGKRSGFREVGEPLVDLNLCRTHCLNIGQAELFTLREGLERDGLAEPHFTVLDCVHCGVSCRRGADVRKLYWWCCPHCERVCEDKVHMDK